ncbi:MAG: Bug family tripartite tricarboxylate transporter substrate binding protein [Candidatus Binatia bacterium]
MKKSTFRRYDLALAVLMSWILLAGVYVGQASEHDLAQHFTGKRINIIVGSSPGGGYDIIARLFAKHAPKHFPGNPTFIVRNMPGASGLKGTQYLFRAEPDGLTAGPHYTHMVMKELAGVDVPGFDVDRLIIVGASTFVRDDYLICADRKVVSSWEDMLKLGRPLRMAAQRPGGGRVPMGAEFVSLVGGPIKMVYGFKSTNEELAAFARGETEVTTCLHRRLPRLFPDLVKQKRLVPLFWWNARPSEKWLKALGKPAPYPIFDLPGLETTEEQRVAFETAVSIHQFLRAFMLPPGTPDAIVKVWRKAYKATTEDPEFVNAAQVANYDVGYGSPEEYERLLKGIKKLSPKGSEFFRQLIGQR